MNPTPRAAHREPRPYNAGGILPPGGYTAEIRSTADSYAWPNLAPRPAPETYTARQVARGALIWLAGIVGAWLGVGGGIVLAVLLLRSWLA